MVPLIYDARMPLQGRWGLQFSPGFQMELNYPKWRGDARGILTRDTRTRGNSTNCPRRSSLLSIKASLEKLRPRIGTDGNCLLLDFHERKTSWKIFSSLGHGYLSPSLPTPLHSLSFTRCHLGHRDLVFSLNFPLYPPLRIKS